MEHHSGTGISDLLIHLQVPAGPGPWLLSNVQYILRVQGVVLFYSRRLLLVKHQLTVTAKTSTALPNSNSND